MSFAVPTSLVPHSAHVLQIRARRSETSQR